MTFGRQTFTGPDRAVRWLRPGWILDNFAVDDDVVWLVRLISGPTGEEVLSLLDREGEVLGVASRRSVTPFSTRNHFVRDEGAVMRFVTRFKAASGNVSGPPGEDEFSAKYPAIWEYLTLEQFDDKTARETSTLLVLTEDGCVKLCLNDRAANATCWVSGATMTAAMTKLEASLASGEAEFRSRPKSAPGVKKPR